MLTFLYLSTITTKFFTIIKLFFITFLKLKKQAILLNI